LLPLPPSTSTPFPPNTNRSGSGTPYKKIFTLRMELLDYILAQLQIQRTLLGHTRAPFSPAT
jgi:hypothetical protein